LERGMGRRKEKDDERQAYRQVRWSRYTRGLFVCSRKVLICEVHGVYARMCAYELQRVSSSEACTGTANYVRPEVEWREEEISEQRKKKCRREIWRIVRAKRVTAYSRHS